MLSNIENKLKIKNISPNGNAPAGFGNTAKAKVNSSSKSAGSGSSFRKSR